MNDIFGLPINSRKLIKTSFNDKEQANKRSNILGVDQDAELKTHMVLDRRITLKV